MFQSIKIEIIQIKLFSFNEKLNNNNRMKSKSKSSSFQNETICNKQLKLLEVTSVKVHALNSVHHQPAS